MNKKMFRSTLAAILAVVMVAGLLPWTVLTVGAAGNVHVLDTAVDLEPMKELAKKDGDTISAGTDDFFTIHFSEKTKIDSSSKSWDDGYSSSQRLNFGGKMQVGATIKNAIEFTVSQSGTVKIWWASGGAGRQFGLMDGDGNIVVQTNDDVAQNAPFISTLQIPAAGTYYLGGITGKNYIFKIEVTQGVSEDVPLKDWASVAAPEILSVVDEGDGDLVVTVKAVVGSEGGDEISVTMFDADGTALDTKRSIAEKGEHTLTFAPEASGRYTFEATLKREGESPKVASEKKTADFVYPLDKPVVISATSKGSGKVSIVWIPVKEAEYYEIYCDDVPMGSTSDTEYTVSGLTDGKKYAFRVVAVRGGDRVSSDAINATATADEKRVWGFTCYGSSTNEADNGYEGSVNEDGWVTVYSENSKGKVVPGSTDGLAFYYTAIPTEYNFTLRAKMHVDSWTLSNGQEGFGLMVADRLGVSGDKSAFWNNQYMALCSKIEYRYDADIDKVYDLDGDGTKYTMKLGLGVLEKIGVTKENLSKLEAGDTDTINQEFSSTIHALEWSAGLWGLKSSTYNIVGNETSGKTVDVEKEVRTDFILEIQKNNTGYFITYYDEAGNVLCQRKYYGADNLNKLDEEYVYAGFFAARNARVTFSDVELSTILATLDAPAEEKPVTKVVPTVNISSATVTTSGDYLLMLDANVSGTVRITMGSEVLADGDKVEGQVRYTLPVDLTNYGPNRIKIQFTPDPDQDLGPDTILSSTNIVYNEITVTWNKGHYHRKTIYVSPLGLPNGTGSKEYPFDIYTAINNACPGQTIVLMEGTYLLDTTVKIQRGMDGTPEQPIRMIADPAAATRPVLDFQGLCAGIVHGGDYWYFAGFDVTNSQATQKGFQVSGNYNILDQIHAYRNGNTGIQISRYSGSDLFPDWPSNNLILNCTSYLNADPGEEDADGFAAKLTVGEGNVFDGCVAYMNSDDGWDLYAKVETGCIGSVTIRNCVAYSNGIREDGTETEGNGNGFKLGGDSLSGKHVLENSFAFFNKAKGIDSNSCPDVTVRNCVSYNNGSYNVAFYTNDAGNTDFTAYGIISFKDSDIPNKDALTEDDNLKGKGSQDTDKYLNNTNYYWDGSACVSLSGKKLSADIFESLTFRGVERNADGSIDMQGFLERTDAMPADAGVVDGGMPSMDMTTLPDDLAHNYGEDWVIVDPELHWHECECGDKGDVGAHDLVWVVDKEATPSETGLKHRECTVCGYKKVAITTYYEEEHPTEPDTENPVPGGQDATDPGNGNRSVVVIAIVAAVVVVAVGTIVLVMKKKKG